MPTIDSAEDYADFVSGNPKLPGFVANDSATFGDKLLDTALGLGSAFGSVWLDQMRYDTQLNASGKTGFYRDAQGVYRPIPKDAAGNPLPGYTGASMGLPINQNMLVVLGVVAVLFFAFKR